MKADGAAPISYKQCNRQCYEVCTTENEPQQMPSILLSLTLLPLYHQTKENREFCNNMFYLCHALSFNTNDYYNEPVTLSEKCYAIFSQKYQLSTCQTSGLLNENSYYLFL